MDPTAAQLLQQLSDSLRGAGPLPAAAADTLPPEDLDRRRILLVEMAYLLNACFRDVQYWEGVKTEKDTFKQLAAVLLQLAKLPGHQGLLQIGRRSGAQGRSGDRPDYVIRLGELCIDTAIVAAVIKRMGIQFKHIEGRILKFNETLAAEGIDSMLLRLPEESPESMETLRVALRILSCYRLAAEKSAPITFVRNGTSIQLAPVCDDRHLPDPNLTMLAAVNDLSAAAVQELTLKVSALMQRPEGAALRRRVPNVFQAIFAIKSLREKLSRPPIEINSDRGAGESLAGAPMGGGAFPPMVAGGAANPAAAAAAIRAGAPEDAAPAAGSPPGGEPANAQTTAAPSAIMDDAALRAGVVHAIADTHAGAAADAVRHLFAQDYGSIGASDLGGRLAQMSQLLAAMQANPAGAQLMEAVLQRVQTGMDQLPVELLNDVVVDKNEIKVWEGGRERVVGRVEEHLAQAIDAAKDHAAVRRKLRAESGAGPIYLSRDPSALCSFFDLPAEEMESILSLFRSCFDHRGNFQKALFEKRVPELARYHKKIFLVLWEFLKDMPRRADRLPFLNSLQLMIKEIKQPLQAVRILLSDLTGDPAQVSYPDRNAVMLSTQFLRTYNKEINVDIELTPEEILRVHAGLDSKVVNYAGWKVNGDQKRFLTKAVNIRKRLTAAFAPGMGGPEAMPAKFLLALEREIHIFMALVGGNTAASILHSALGVFGNPESPFFSAEQGRQHFYALLQHLSVLVRGIGRVGTEIDLLLIDQVRQREKQFLKMAADPRQAALVRRVFNWADPAKKEIEFRLKGGAPGAGPDALRTTGLSSTNTIDF
ncbi:MAG: hypothetical protein R6V84_05185 [Desulfobacterales bacterium]